MQQHEVKSENNNRKNRRRVGRGDGSGFGSYSGKGMKGQKSRSGGGVRPGFEGGQLPLSKKLPMIRGFTNVFKTKYAVLNVSSLSGFEANSDVTPETLQEKGVLRNVKYPIKILGDGDVSVPLNVSAHKFTTSARAKIEAAGGNIREIL